MGKVSVAIEIDTDRLAGYADSHLAALWHVAQANPEDGFEDSAPAEVAERIGREIIRRWLASTPPELYRHQGQHYYWRQLMKLGKWSGPNGEFVLNENGIDSDADLQRQVEEH